MKIVYYSSHPHLSLESPAGYGTHMREMISAFRSAGHTVFPVVMGGMGTTPDLANGAGGRTKSVAKTLVPAFAWESMKDYLLLNKDLAYESQLQETLARIQPDLVYERASCLQLSGVRAAGKLNIPHILEMNAPYVEERKEHFGIASFFEQRASQVERTQLRESSRVVVVSEALRDYLVEKHNISPDKFMVMPNAVNLSKVQADPHRAREIRALYNVQNKMVVGFVGSLFKWHGVDLLIRAVKKLKDNGFQVMLFVVGDGAIAGDLKQLSKTLQVEEDVIFTGSVPHSDVFDYIEAMDITVMANSNWYGSPVKIFEYGAIGKPIVAPNNGPVREVIRHEVDGLLIDNEYDLVRNLRRLIENPHLRSRIAESFQRRVIREHTWAKNAARVLNSTGVMMAC